jgi:hypothetical protein
LERRGGSHPAAGQTVFSGAVRGAQRRDRRDRRCRGCSRRWPGPAPRARVAAVGFPGELGSARGGLVCGHRGHPRGGVRPGAVRAARLLPARARSAPSAPLRCGCSRERSEPRERSDGERGSGGNGLWGFPRWGSERAAPVSLPVNFARAWASRVPGRRPGWAAGRGRRGGQGTSVPAPAGVVPGPLGGGRGPGGLAPSSLLSGLACCGPGGPAVVHHLAHAGLGVLGGVDVHAKRGLHRAVSQDGRDVGDVRAIV